MRHMIAEPESDKKAAKERLFWKVLFCKIHDWKNIQAI